MIAIKNATLVMRDHFIPNAVLLIENGKIVIKVDIRYPSTYDGEKLKKQLAEHQYRNG